MQMPLPEEYADFAPELEIINTRIERLIRRTPVILSAARAKGRDLECLTRIGEFEEEDYTFQSKQRQYTDTASAFGLPLVCITELDFIGPDAELYYRDEIHPAVRLLSVVGIEYTPERELEQEVLVWDAGQKRHRRQHTGTFSALKQAHEGRAERPEARILTLVFDKVGDVIIDQNRKTATRKLTSVG